MFICLPSRCPYMQGTQLAVYLTHPRVYTAGSELGEKLTVKQFNWSVFARLRIIARTEAAEGSVDHCVSFLQCFNCGGKSRSAVEGVCSSVIGRHSGQHLKIIAFVFFLFNICTLLTKNYLLAYILRWIRNVHK